MTQLTGPFDIRVFSNKPEYRTRDGLACIIVARTPEDARKIIARETKDGYWAAAYEPNTARRVTLP